MQNAANNLKTVRGSVRPYIPENKIGEVAEADRVTVTLKQGNGESRSYSTVDFTKPEMVAKYGHLCFTVENAKEGTHSLFVEQIVTTVYPGTRNVLLSSEEAPGQSYDRRMTVVVKDFPLAMDLGAILPRLPEAFVQRFLGLSVESIMGDEHRAILGSSRFTDAEKAEMKKSWAASWLVTDPEGNPIPYAGAEGNLPQYGRNRLTLLNGETEPEIVVDSRDADLRALQAGELTASGNPFESGIAG